VPRGRTEYPLCGADPAGIIILRQRLPSSLEWLMTPLRTAVTWMARSPVRAFVVIFLLGFSVRFFFLA
jgi:hypothetical protein